MVMGSHGKRTRHSKATSRKDRLSSLPDHILIDIISFLPLSSALASSVLSRRWKPLWTHVTSLNVDNNLLSQNPLSLIDQLTSSSNFKLRLSLDNILFCQQKFIDSWVLNVCSHNVKIIEVTISNSDPWVLPSCVFQTSTLVELDIDHVWSLSLPCEINLPNLKKLWIRSPILFPPVKVLGNLINSCSSLEDLFLDLCKEQHLDVKFIVPNLKRLKLLVSSFRGKQLEIDAPNLERVTLGGCLLYPYEINLNTLSKFIESISGVRFLEFKLMFKPLMLKRLMKFLELNPTLKVLTLDIDLNSLDCTTTDLRSEDCRLWGLGHLRISMKTVQIEIDSWNFKHEIHVLKMVKCLVRSDNDLEQLTFGIRCNNCKHSYLSDLKMKLVKCLGEVKNLRNYKGVHSQNVWRLVAWL